MCLSLGSVLGVWREGDDWEGGQGERRKPPFLSIPNITSQCLCGGGLGPVYTGDRQGKVT